MCLSTLLRKREKKNDKTVTAKEFDEKFGNSEDISEHFDFSKSIKLKDFNQLKTDTKKVNSDEKNDLNIQNHHVSCEEAKEVFLDPMHISKLDHRFDYFEERWITLGTTTKDKILVVANMFFDENGEEIIRIISARKANQKERIFYEQH